MTADTDITPIEVDRLRVRPQFVFVRGGRSERRRALVVQARKRAGEAPGPHAGAGFTATKKIGNAVVRNRAKRRLREAARQLLPQLGRPGWDYVFIARQETADIGWPRLLDDMESALLSLAAD
ncbi:MAG TPA: ribonuclease P protein component [Hyphomonas sp.]|nr:ribonuclease P protein component [Hyphomonas sp.]